MRGKLINALALPALPLLLIQSRILYRKIPRLPPAAGPRAGLVEGTGAPLRVLVVGESTAVGVGVDTIDEAMVGRFARILNTRTGRPVAWEAAGLSGATVSEGHAHLLPGIAARPRDLVVILFGANDTLARRPARAFAEDMRALLTDLRPLVGEAPILISSVPPLGTFPALPQPLKAYLGAWSNWLDSTMAQLNLPGTHYAPVNIEMEAVLFASDGFHPGPVGYHAWAEILAAAAFKLELLLEQAAAEDLSTPL